MFPQRFCRRRHRVFGRFRPILRAGSGAVEAEIENVLDRCGRHTDDIAELLREVEHEAVCGAGRQSERVFGALALRLGFTTADLGKNGESNCDDGNRKRTADPIALARGSPPAGLPG